MLNSSSQIFFIFNHGTVPQRQQQKQAAGLDGSAILYWESFLMASPDWSLISC